MYLEVSLFRFIDAFSFLFFAQIYPTSAVYPSFEGNVIEAGKFKISRAATWRSY